MIKQGTNKPIILTFETAPTDLSVTLHNEIQVLKHWAMADMISHNGTMLEAPVTQEESFAWEEGPCEIEVRWTDADGIVMKRVIRENIEHTTDDTVLTVTENYVEESYEEEEIIPI